MLQEINIQDLFGRFSYDIKLKEDGLTIITGPNGYGKTTILRILKSLSQGYDGLDFLFNLNFKNINLVFDKKDIKIIKEKGRLLINNNNISLNKYRNRKRIRIHSGKNIFFKRNFENLLVRSIKEETKDTIVESKTNNFKFETLDLLRGIFIKNNKEVTTIENDTNEIKTLLGNIYYIHEQRLVNYQNKNSKKEVIDAIRTLPKEFIAMIDKCLNRYVDLSNQLDRSYPKRLFSNEEELTENEFSRCYHDIEEKFAKLGKYGITSLGEDYHIGYKKSIAKALKIYFEDLTQKYNVYDELISKFEMYESIINNKFKFKKIKIERKYGIKVIDADDKELPLSELSSGEKQELILFFNLIFKTNDDSLLLIDEPEISLHVVWQENFINDLMEIIRNSKIKAIIATHSPQIINRYWDNQIDLGGLYNA